MEQQASVGTLDFRPDPNHSRVVIVGGGFGGLYAAKTLRHAPVQITLVDRRNYHLFQPLLYQVATAALNPSDIAAPIRAVLRRQENASVIMGDATSVDLDQKRIQLTDGQLAYDILIIATGATHSYFSHPEWEENAPGLKTIDDALEIRRRVFRAFEAAERESDPDQQRAWLNFVVIGGGPTGVELAGALSEIARQTMVRDFRRINPSSARVILIEGLERLLPPYPPDLSEKAAAQLRALGVEVMTSTLVTSVTDHEVRGGETIIPTRTVLWAAGVQASPLARGLGTPLDRAGRVLVEPDLSVPGHPEVFVIGDLAAMTQSNGTPVPGVAPAAIQGGIHTAKNIARILNGQPTIPFRYRDKGSLATIGRAAGVADFGRVKLSGFIAWAAWLSVHVFFLIGFRNRLLVMLQWAWAYVTYQRGARLITGKVEPLMKE
jgi:NADH dehydrogenase, FAD-containing subunit